MSEGRPRLGRGLASLIRNSAEPDGQYQPVSAAAQPVHAPPAYNPARDGLVLLPVEAISPNPHQPRRTFNEELLAELAQSIKLHGLLEPVLVIENPAGNGQNYQLIAGERRLRASKLAGIKEIPCIIRAARPQSMLEMALIENIHRDDLNPVEKAMAYRDLMDQFTLTQEQAAQRVGQPRTTVANYLRLLDLCDEVQQLIVGGALSFGHAKVLASLAGDSQAQLDIAQRVVRQGLSVRQLEDLLIQRAASLAAGNATVPDPAGSAKAPYLADLERQLGEAVGTRVLIRPGRAKHSGKITIEYYSLEDFDRITGALGAKIDS